MLHAPYAMLMQDPETKIKMQFAMVKGVLHAALHLLALFTQLLQAHSQSGHGLSFCLLPCYCPRLHLKVCDYGPVAVRKTAFKWVCIRPPAQQRRLLGCCSLWQLCRFLIVAASAPAPLCPCCPTEHLAVVLPGILNSSAVSVADLPAGQLGA